MLARLHRLAWDEDEWFAGLARAIDGVDARGAAWVPPGGGNTIWQTVNHLNFYDEQVLAHLQKRRPQRQARTNEETFGEPGDPEDAAGWESAAAEMRRIHTDLQDALDALDDAALDAPLHAGSKNPAIQSLTDWIQHDAHHAGQILLLRKQMGSWPAQRS